jgi:hypothetical protein
MDTSAIIQQLGELLSRQLAALKSLSLRDLSENELELYRKRDDQIQQLLCQLPHHTPVPCLRGPEQTRVGTAGSAERHDGVLGNLEYSDSKKKLAFLELRRKRRCDLS